VEGETFKRVQSVLKDGVVYRLSECEEQISNVINGMESPWFDGKRLDRID